MENLKWDGSDIVFMAVLGLFKTTYIVSSIFLCCLTHIPEIIN